MLRFFLWYSEVRPPPSLPPSLPSHSPAQPPSFPKNHPNFLAPQKEGKLGDMSMLRGRVLGDEEAAKYWDQRGAEPGGGGVREGVFRDDLASRSTQRRGAPGRKAWVKPPPKPPLDLGKAKELEAKRNFLALKVWELEVVKAFFGGMRCGAVWVGFFFWGGEVWCYAVWFSSSV